MEQQSKLAILGISGSGRKGSYNTALLEAAKYLLPQDVTLEDVDISRLPLYNQDLEHEMPRVVKGTQEEDSRRRSYSLRYSRTQLFRHCCFEECHRMGQQAAEGRFMERQARRSNQRLNRAPRRSESPATPSTDNDRPKHVLDQ